MTKNWAAGSRETFLKGHLPGYRLALLSGHTRANEYIDTVINAYFAIYHWRLPVTAEPSLGSTPESDENMSSEDQDFKRRVIEQMKKVCSYSYYSQKKRGC